jgi:hypothetical protein
MQWKLAHHRTSGSYARAFRQRQGAYLREVVMRANAAKNLTGRRKTGAPHVIPGPNFLPALPKALHLDEKVDGAIHGDDLR